MEQDVVVLFECPAPSEPYREADSDAISNAARIVDAPALPLK
jgi:hypothetical protein